MLGSLSFMLLATVSAPPCESLPAVPLPQATIAEVHVVQAGPFVQPGGARGAAPAGAPQARGAAPGRGGAPAGAPAAAALPLPQHCRVTMVLKPTSDSNINAELWMPTDNWNGKLLVVGNGGVAGSIPGGGDTAGAARLGCATPPCARVTPPPPPIPATRPPTVPMACSRSAMRRRSSTSPTAPSTRRR